MSILRKRRSKSSVFQGKDGLITPRDLLRWAERTVTSKQELGMEGYMLLAERLRDEDEKLVVKNTIEEILKIHVDCDELLYYGSRSKSRKQIDRVYQMQNSDKSIGLSLQEIAPTKSLLRLLTLVERCVKQKEPVLLVGETGCGKTTVVQLISILLNRDLQIVNCHASTETSDLLGGLRPLRGRGLLLNRIIEKGQDICPILAELPNLKIISIPSFLENKMTEIPSNGAQQVHDFVKKLLSMLAKINTTQKKDLVQPISQSQSEKRRKLENGTFKKMSDVDDAYQSLTFLINEIEADYQQYVSLFEWVDGPLVNAMKSGNLFLLDEMSLAEDAVLERLNSVLEPSRTLTLAEKGGDLSDDDSRKGSEVKAHTDFLVFATMNPGGDFGKRELSPALRSRFTEIWVPSITDPSDIDLVLKQALSAKKNTSDDSIKVLDVKNQMLSYVNWFNNDICGKEMSTCADFVLSLRDVLAWARFVIDTCYSMGRNVSLWSAYVHGASLMHLDGLGLGTGLSQEDAVDVKIQAKKFLCAQVPNQLRQNTILGFENELEGMNESLLYRNNQFGIEPFFISNGQMNIPTQSNFKLSAPTTAMNLRRVLRAMQIAKPILLEGSPGVGKTSLIAALASMSGHNLVRINLSEQTDVTDLMGSDLPVPDDADNGQASSTSFKWCDGALLKAIKNGDWVLLDELNLASQSVLEGLNSCLDHRASVYIPELGQTFQCPPTFRIFAAQNPLTQGGGRKGLPKSFLNRFTKVYVEALTNKDLRGIVSARFPLIPQLTVERMVHFNGTVQRDIESRKYGQLGSPWEFNLRDVFRWCELVCSSYERNGQIECGTFADTIYFQRLRCKKDRELMTKRYEECFGDISCLRRTVEFNVYEKSIEIGEAKVKRNIEILSSSEELIIGADPSRLRSSNQPMEAVTFCVQMNWPCLLVGPPASGKSTILKVLAEGCNVRLEEVMLTPSSDVNELIGCFEQIDSVEVENRLLRYLKEIISRASTMLVHSDEEISFSQSMGSLHYFLLNKVQSLKRSLGVTIVLDQNEVLSIAKKLIHIAKTASSRFPYYSAASTKLIELATEDISALENKRNSDSSSMHFRWVDGVLITALEKGYWLHLENVNLCPSSVLDRLNPLMESDGVMVLTECGIKDGDNGMQGTSRVVKPHPNFRLFLSQNPSFGEVSRAMRNRCIEVNLLNPIENLASNVTASNSSKEIIDMLDMVSQNGIRSSSLAKYMIQSHMEEIGVDIQDDSETSRVINEWAELTNSAYNRGFNLDSSTKLAQQVAYQIHSEEIRHTLNYSRNDGGEDMILNCTNTRDVWTSSKSQSDVFNDATLLRPMETKMHLPLGVYSFGKQTIVNSEHTSTLDKYAPSLTIEDCRLPIVRNNLIANFVRRATTEDAKSRSRFLRGYHDEKSRILRALMAKYVTSSVRISTLRGKSNDSTLLSNIKCNDRLATLYSEYQLYHSLEHKKREELQVTELSAMALSFCVYENKIERSNVNCQVIPLLYPLFLSIDAYLQALEKEITDNLEFLQNMQPLKQFYSNRDRLWVFLKDASVSNEASYLGFNESIFLVHWNWLEKARSCLVAVIDCSESLDMKSARQKMDLICESIERELFMNSGGSSSISNLYWKLGGHPLVPAQAFDWMSIEEIRRNDAANTPLTEEKFGYINIASGMNKCLTLEELLNSEHPYLIMSSEIKMEVLSALCMAHWTTTDEMSSSIRRVKRNYDLSKVQSLLAQRIGLAKDDMSQRLRLHAIDTTIHSAYNKIDLEDMERMGLKNSEDNEYDLVENLLSSFGDIQVTQLVEFWCVNEELWIIENLAFIINSKSETVVDELCQVVLPRLKAFIETVIARTMWPVSELRPLQSIVWALESGIASAASMGHLFLCAYSTLIVNSTKHQWCNTFNDLTCISDSLIMPSFWNSDRLRQSEKGDDMHNVDFMNGWYAGSARLQHNVISACLFRLLGLNSGSSRSSKQQPYLTLENCKSRRMQNQNLIQFFFRDLSVLGRKACKKSILLYLVKNMINGLKNSFDHVSDMERLRSFFVFGVNDKSSSDEEIDLLLQKCKDKKFSGIATKTLKPLTSILCGDDSDSDETIALASVYVGIIAFHLLMPASPLDPGVKPAAKISEWNSYLQHLSSTLVALRMHSGLSTGNFYPETPEVATLLQQANHASRKRDGQEKKRVERPSNSPPFHELYREVQHFANTISSIDNVLKLIDSIRHGTSSDIQSSCQAMEINWQSSVSAFSTKLLSNYACYEDVITPCLAALGIMQNGIRSFAHSRLNCKESMMGAVLAIQNNMMQYPNIAYHNFIDPNSISNISSAFDAHAMNHTDQAHIQKLGKRCKISYFLAGICQLALLKSGNIYNENELIRIASLLFGSISRAWDSDCSKTITETSNENETQDEREERQFREQFPDHGKDFAKIIETTENMADGAELDEDYTECEDIRAESMNIADNEANLLAELHSVLFDKRSPGPSNLSRMQTFILTYKAAALLNHITVRNSCLQSESKMLNAHCFALGLHEISENGIPFANALEISQNQETSDFHKDPNPSEVLKACKPLKDLLHRVAQLLRVFPGNAILIALGQVAETMLQLDLGTVSLGKLLTGLEMVLRKAQDWEQHASQRVALGENLVQVSRLVAQWRKMELNSWSNLLDVRDKNYTIQTRQHWMRLYLLLTSENYTEKEQRDSTCNDFQIKRGLCFPGWVWKGSAQRVNNITTMNYGDDIGIDEETTEILKALDTFILTSGIGQFHERLQLIGSFANQLQKESKLIHAFTDGQNLRATILASLFEHYSEFIPIIASRKSKLREPIEQKLKNEVKLAKWDEQSYYSLAESSEKSHRKLMMIVREYDDVLQSSVGDILEESFLNGIRSNSEVTAGKSNEAPTTEIPSTATIFPDCKGEEDEQSGLKDSALVIPDMIVNFRDSNRRWTTLEDNFDSKYLQNMEKYFKKMSLMFKSKSNPDSYASRGATDTNFICASIFERIATLRGNGTKQMKQRGLVDLFKYLRKQGYSSMKWSVPKEIRGMNNLFQLSSPAMERLSKKHTKTLQDAERYFHRCTVELSRLRSEVVMIGSAYMSKREMDLMVGFSEHGLLMLCQQRCNIAKVINDVEIIDDLMCAYDKIQEKLPKGQLSLLPLVQLFDRSYASMLEIIHQTVLMAKTIASSNKKEGQLYRDIISVFEGCCSLLTEVYQPKFSDIFIMKERQEEINHVKVHLDTVLKSIESCISQSLGAPCFPSNFFESCLSQVQQCCDQAKTCNDYKYNDIQMDSNELETDAMKVLLSELVESSLIAAQNLQKGTFDQRNEEEEESSEDTDSIWQNHLNVLQEWDMINLGKVGELLDKLRQHLLTQTYNDESVIFELLTADASCLVLQVLDACKGRLNECLSFFRNASKFEYIKLRMFRVLIAKGFCADDVEDGGSGEGDGNMKFEDDVEGTGMAEGEGKNDVTDQLENEEQILGLKGDEPQEKSEDKKELGEDEADKGMEMESEFDGELFDVPDKKDNDNENDEDEEEELDREMGEENDPNEQVVDEKMWDEDDEDEEGNQQEEKFEKDSKMSGEKLEDELRTKEEDEEQENGTGKDSADKADDAGEQQHDEDIPKDDGDQDQNEGGKDEDELVNDDLDDNYEDKHTGVDVRNEEEEQDDDNNDETMDLNDDLALDDNEGEDVNEDGENGNDEADSDSPEDAQEEDEATGTAGEVDDRSDDENEADDNEEEMDTVQNMHQTLGEDDNMNVDEEQEDVQDEEDKDEVADKNDIEGQEDRHNDAHGVASKSGADAIKQVEEDDDDAENEDAAGEDNEEDDNGAGEGDTNENNPGGGGQSNDSSGDIQSGKDTSAQMKQSMSMNAPNPFRDPGDAEEFWHKKLDVIAEAEDDGQLEESTQKNDNDCEGNNDDNTKGAFEFTTENQEGTTQVLGGVTEDDETKLNQEQNQNAEESQETQDTDMNEKEDNAPEMMKRDSSKREEAKQSQKQSEDDKSKSLTNEEDEIDHEDTKDVEVENELKSHGSEDEDNEEDVIDTENKVVTDLAQLQVNDNVQTVKSSKDIMEIEHHGAISYAEAEEARNKWSQLNAETNNLSRRLCEKLRLVMEPLVASKLRGDYRTGKRINMKRVIGYIASGYRKDKIWLRRTKPGKRDYRVLLAVDNSESMKAGAGDVALIALATLATGMSQLEIGQLGVASFGEEMKLLHPFHAPFTASSGADLVSNFTFDDKRTRTALCVESAIAALESQSDSSASMQLVFMISDGRIERDSREHLRHLVREMTERSILLVMIIVEGDKKGNIKTKDSIVNMKEVSFQNGKPKVEHFIDDYPFPYYMILQDMNTLPEVLGDALKQWFEMMRQNQSQT